MINHSSKFALIIETVHTLDVLRILQLPWLLFFWHFHVIDGKIFWKRSGWRYKREVVRILSLLNFPLFHDHDNVCQNLPVALVYCNLWSPEFVWVFLINNVSLIVAYYVLLKVWTFEVSMICMTFYCKLTNYKSEKSRQNER